MDFVPITETAPSDESGRMFALQGGRNPRFFPIEGGSVVDTGLGKPCTIKIETVYTGKYGHGWFAKDMLATSAMKSLGVTEAQPRMINFLERKVGRRRVLHDTSATQPGTRLLFYSPALTRLRGSMSIELAFDDVPERQFEGASNFLKNVAGLAIFLPHSHYLMAGSQIVNALGRFGNALWDSRPEWSAEFSLDLSPVIGRPTTSGLYLGMDNNVWIGLSRSGYTVQEGVLTDRTGNQYSGDHPYVLISIDGRPDAKLEEFQPLAMTAEIASRFLAAKDALGASLDMVFESLKIANDWSYRKEATALSEQIAQLKLVEKEETDALSDLVAKSPNDESIPVRRARISEIAEEIRGAEARRDAAVKNIINKDLRP